MTAFVLGLTLGALLGYGWVRRERHDDTEAHWSDVQQAVGDGCHEAYHDLSVHAPERDLGEL